MKTYDNFDERSSLVRETQFPSISSPLTVGTLCLHATYKAQASQWRLSPCKYTTRGHKTSKYHRSPTIQIDFNCYFGDLNADVYWDENPTWRICLYIPLMCSFDWFSRKPAMLPPSNCCLNSSRDIILRISSPPVHQFPRTTPYFMKISPLRPSLPERSLFCSAVEGGNFQPIRGKLTSPAFSRLFSALDPHSWSEVHVAAGTPSETGCLSDIFSDSFNFHVG